MRVSVNLALVHQAFLVVMQKFDGVLDGDHVLFALAVNLVEHSGERRRFSGTRRPGNQNESTRFVAKPLYNEGQTQGVKALNLPRNGTKNGADSAALIENVAAKSGQVFQSEGKVQLEVFLEAVLLCVGQNAIGQRLRVGRRQRRHIQSAQASRSEE